MNALAEKYLMLLNNFGQHSDIGSSIEVTTEQLAQALFCTTRNAKIIVHKLVDEGLINWQSGRGRGNVSRIAFLAEKEPLLMEWSQEMSRKGEYKQAIELLQLHSNNSAITDRFIHWLNNHFGYQSERTSGNEALDTLRFPVFCPIMTMDPVQVYSSFDAHMIRQVFDRLVEYDATSGQILPGLAHSWEANADATEWTFHLRKGIRFHHGRELKPEDIRFTLERMRGEKPQSWLVRTLKEVQCIGPRTVRILLSKPNTIFLRYLGSAGMSIVPQELLLEDESQFWRKPIGTGPFRITQWTSDCCEMSANPDYYYGRAHLDRVIIAIMPEDTARLSENASWQQMVRAKGQMVQNEQTAWRSIEQLCRGCTMLSWNMGMQGPQQSNPFRRAIHLLINRTELIRQLGEDRMYPARGYRPGERTPYMEEEANIVEGMRLLKESGYRGEELNLFTYGSNSSDANWIKQRLGEFGIKVNVYLESLVTIRQPEIVKQAHLVLYGVVFSMEDVCEIENYEQCGNFLRECLAPAMLEWIIEQINDATACHDPSYRRQILTGIEGRLREEALVLFLLHRKNNTYVHSTVKGVGLNSLGWMDFKDIWLDTQGLSG